MQETAKFESWGIVELFGHSQIAGKISEATIGGCSFVRVDVPSIDQSENAASPWAYTRLFGQGAIYAMNPTSEAVARARAKLCQEPPYAYELKVAIAEEAVKRYKERTEQKTIASVPVSSSGCVIDDDDNDDYGRDDDDDEDDDYRS